MDTRSKKIKQIKHVVELVDKRQSANQYACSDYCNDSKEQQGRLKVLSKTQKELDQKMLELRKLYKAGKFDGFSNEDLIALVLVFSSFWSSDVPINLDSQDIVPIIIGSNNVEKLPTVIDSLFEKNGRLNKYLNTRWMRTRKIGWEFEIKNPDEIMELFLKD